ncbi:MAG TPA: ABC transporter substrate-binding protein [Anaeromyxobacteraceae bacterium]
MRALILLLAFQAGGGATDAVRARDAEIRAALPPPGAEVTPEARRRIEEIVARALDLRGMAQAALGPRWAQMTSVQRRRLVAAFERRFREVGASELEAYRDTAVEYRAEVERGGRVEVPTRLVVKGEPTEVTYALRRQGAGWRIVDLSVDGVSTVDNYRASFARVIARDGVEGLIRRLEKGGAAAEKPR